MFAEMPLYIFRKILAVRTTTAHQRDGEIIFILINV